MDRPFSSSSPQLPSEYLRSVETTSSRAMPIQASNIPRSYSPSFYPARTSSGRWAMDYFNMAREDRIGQHSDEFFESYLRRHKCLRLYDDWEMCLQDSIRNGEDYRLNCSLASKLLRNCVRDT